MIDVHEPKGIRLRHPAGEFVFVTVGHADGWILKRHPDGHWSPWMHPSAEERLMVERKHADALFRGLLHMGKVKRRLLGRLRAQADGTHSITPGG